MRVKYENGGKGGKRILVFVVGSIGDGVRESN